MRTSQRVPECLEANSLTRELIEANKRGDRILDLTITNPTHCGFHFPEEAIRKALASQDVLDYSPDPSGSVKAREAIAAWHGHHVASEDITLTASTSEAYSWLFKLLCDPGDEVMVPSPSYPLFHWLAHLEGVATKHVPAYFHERWHLDLEAMEAACTERTRAVIAVNPNNPTGHYLSRTEWAGLLALCARQNLALIVDEVFADYTLEAPEDRLRTALEMNDPPCPLFVLSGLSKIVALPQVKLGWIVARGRHAKALKEPLSFIADQYLSVSASAQGAAPDLLQLAPNLQTQISKRLKENLATTDSILSSHAHLSRLPAEGGWSLLLRRPSLDSDEACTLRLLREPKVFIHPGHFFDLPGDRYLVISLLTPPAVLDEGLQKSVPFM